VAPNAGTQFTTLLALLVQKYKSFRRSGASGSERRYSVYYYFTCFTSTKVQIPTPEAQFAVGNYALGTQFTCFTSAKVQILTQLEQFAVGNYALALEPLGIDPATVPPDSALAFVRSGTPPPTGLVGFSDL
jgi:hypothetical protein